MDPTSVTAVKHAVILIIITALFILFATGIAVPINAPTPVIVPPAG